MEKLTSIENKTVKYYVKLINDKKARDESGFFACESEKIIEEFIKDGLEISSLFILKNYLNKPNLLGKYFSKINKIYEINDMVAKKFSQLTSVPNAFAIFKKPVLTNEIKLENHKKYLILDQIQDPGNIGTIIRTAAAFAIDAIILVNGTVDLFNSKIIRYTMGNILKIPIYVITDLEVLIKKLKQKQIKVYGTCLDDHAKLLNKVTFDKSSAIILGNEGKGINSKYLKQCDELIRIPFKKPIESLNVAVAACILMWEISK